MSGLEVTMMKRIGELNAEVKYLQDKVERLTAEVSYDKRVQLHVDKLAAEFTQSEVERLKAENERLRASSFVTAVPSEEYEKLKAQVERQKAELERLMFLLNNAHLANDRLRKAGDLLAFHYISHGRKFFPNDPLPPSITEWNAAKEGRPNE